MSGDDLALETQLLLQGVTQLTHATAVDSEVQGSEKPLVSEYEAATDALLAKLRKKKAANRMQQQQLNQQRFGLPKASTMFRTPSGSKNSPTKSKLPMSLKLPVTVAATVASRKKQQMVLQLKTQALQQGALQMAKLFGYKNHEEHVKHLNELDERKIWQDEVKEREEEGIEEEVDDEIGSVDVENIEEGNGETLQVEEGKKVEETKLGSAARRDVDEGVLDKGVFRETEASEIGSEDNQMSKGENEAMSRAVVKQRKRVSCIVKSGEEDGNEADSEHDNHKDEVDDADDDFEDSMSAAGGMSDSLGGEQGTTEKDDGALVVDRKKVLADKAAGYRSLLRAEALQNRKRKRLMKSRGNGFVESEAEEDDEEDVLNIGGLGDFGFGVPQSKTQESKEAEEERRALVLREDDLDYIVDNLSDDERAQEQDLDEMFRREREEMDRQQVKEVMRNVKEGFGRNRRAFSGLPSGSGARGRFNLDELVAADGSRFEAARLGLLESDEELSEDDDGKKKKKAKVNGISEEEEEEEEEIDEEADMERMLRERFLNQPKIYMTSSESGSDEEEEDAKNSGSDGDDIESDEERERQQMKLFSERARINRRMQRMKDMQRQIALQDNGVDSAVKSDAAIPNILLEEDEDSQELMHLLNRTNVDSIPSIQKATGGGSQNASRLNGSHRKLDRFTSYGGITSVSQTSSSFSRVIDQCKIFNAHSANGAEPSKSFIFTSFSSDKKANDVNGDPDHDGTKASAYLETSKNKSRGDAKRMAKRHHALDSSNSAVGPTTATQPISAHNEQPVNSALPSHFRSLQAHVPQMSSTSSKSTSAANGDTDTNHNNYATDRFSANNSGTSDHTLPNVTPLPINSSSSLDPVGVNGPYHVGNSDGNTCSYHASQDNGSSCRQPRTCYECLNSDVPGVSAGCLLAPSGFCEDMTSYETSLDFRRNVTGEDLHLTGWYNYFPSVNSTYCEPTDEACGRCHDLVQSGSWTNQSFDWRDTDRNVSMDVMRHFCEGLDGCVCVMACEADNWEANMPPACGNEGITSNNDKNAASEGVTSYSSMLIFYLVLQVTLLAVYMYKRGICRRMTQALPPPPRPEGPYNNVNAISCPSHRLRLSGWRKTQSALIESENKQRAFVSQQPQCIASPRVEGAAAQAEASYNQTLSLSSEVSLRDSETARAAYVEVQECLNQGQNSCFSGAMQAADNSGDVVVNEVSCVETRAEGAVPRTESVSSCVAILSTSTRNVAS